MAVRERPLHQRRQHASRRDRLDQQSLRARRARRRDRAGLLVVPERQLRKAPRLGPATHARLHAAELSRHERHRLRRRHAGRRRVAARRRRRCGTRGTGAQAGVATDHSAAGRQRGARGQRETCDHARAWQEPRDAAHVRERASRRSLRHAARVQRGDAGAGHQAARRTQGRLRSDLVRLGLRPRLHARAGVRDAASRHATRLPLGHAWTMGGRWRKAIGRRSRPSSPTAMPT